MEERFLVGQVATAAEIKSTEGAAQVAPDSIDGRDVVAVVVKSVGAEAVRLAAEAVERG